MIKNYFLIFIFFIFSKSIFAQYNDPYLGEIRMFAGNYAPVGWAFCNGQELQIAGNDALYVILGTTYGGDGITTFNLPDLRGRVPVGAGQGSGLSNKVLGSKYGNETTTLIAANLPAHTHALEVRVNNGNATTYSPATNTNVGTSGFDSGKVFVPNTSYTSEKTNLISNNALVKVQSSGQSNPISLIKPYMSINYIIAVTGIFPTPN